MPGSHSLLWQPVLQIEGRGEMKIFEGLYGFLWNSMAANNCNTYLIDGPARVLIDPGHLRLFEHVAIGLEEAGLGLGDIDLVITTHAHPDHLESIKLFKNYPTLFAIHQKDWALVKEMGAYLGAVSDVDSYAPDFFLTEGDLKVKGMEFHVVHTPGHSPGSISLYWPEHKALFTGDVIFKDGLGRTDLPGGNGETLKQSIKRLSLLDAEWMFPGHGGFISGADRVQSNFERVEKYWFGFI